MAASILEINEVLDGLIEMEVERTLAGNSSVVDPFQDRTHLDSGNAEETVRDRGSCSIPNQRDGEASANVSEQQDDTLKLLILHIKDFNDIFDTELCETRIAILKEAPQHIPDRMTWQKAAVETIRDVNNTALNTYRYLGTGPIKLPDTPDTAHLNKIFDNSVTTAMWIVGGGVKSDLSSFRSQQAHLIPGQRHFSNLEEILRLVGGETSVKSVLGVVMDESREAFITALLGFPDRESEAPNMYKDIMELLNNCSSSLSDIQ